MTYHSDSYEGVGAIAATRPAPRSAPAPMFSSHDSPELRLQRAAVRLGQRMVYPGVRVTRQSRTRAPLLVAGRRPGRPPLGATNLGGPGQNEGGGGDGGTKPPIRRVGLLAQTPPVTSFATSPRAPRPARGGIAPVITVPVRGAAPVRQVTIMTAPPVTASPILQIGTGIGQPAPQGGRPASYGGGVRPAHAEVIDAPELELELEPSAPAPVAPPAKSRTPLFLAAGAAVGLFLLLRKH